VTLFASIINDMGQADRGTTFVDSLFVRNSEADDAEIVFGRTVQSACGFLWALGVPERALAALYDVIESVCGEQGLRAMLLARYGTGHDAEPAI
jgi:hypothetical protein